MTKKEVSFTVLCVLVVVLLSSLQLVKLNDINCDNLQKEENKTVHDQFRMARNQSFGFFDDISDGLWKRMQNIVADYVDHLYPDDPTKFLNNPKTWYQTNYEPNFSCQLERRVGGNGGVINGNGDGGKWICDPHRIASLAKERKAKDPSHPGCVIYSVGSNGVWEFELGMQEILGNGTCEFHIFDMGDFEGTMPKNLDRAYYHRWGLKKQDPNASDMPTDGKEYYGLKDTIKLLGHENLDTIDVFKIDCEGCEWKTYMDFFDPAIPHLQQIQIEVHNTPPIAIEFFDSFKQEGYVTFHKEPNIQYTDGNCVEYAFLKLEKDFFLSE